MDLPGRTGNLYKIPISQEVETAINTTPQKFPDKGLNCWYTVATDGNMLNYCYGRPGTVEFRLPYTSYQLDPTVANEYDKRKYSTTSGPEQLTGLRRKFPIVPVVIVLALAFALTRV